MHFLWVSKTRAKTLLKPSHRVFDFCWIQNESSSLVYQFCSASTADIELLTKNTHKEEWKSEREKNELNIFMNQKTQNCKSSVRIDKPHLIIAFSYIYIHINDIYNRVRRLKIQYFLGTKLFYSMKWTPTLSYTYALKYSLCIYTIICIILYIYDKLFTEAIVILWEIESIFCHWKATRAANTLSV